MVAVEKWSGREAKALREAMRLSVRDFAARLGISDRTVSKWESAGASLIPRPHMQAILDTALSTAGPDVQARFRLQFGAGSVIAPPAGSWSASSAHVISSAAKDSENFVERAVSFDGGRLHLDALHTAIDHIVNAYPHQAVYPTFLEMLQLRDIVFGHIESRRHPRQERDLCLMAGVICGVLANASFDLGYLQAAESQARTALVCAERAGSNWLRVWLRGMQSLIAYWDGRFDAAASLAVSARGLRPEQGTAAVRLASIEARARARTGDTDGVQEALAQATMARELTTNDELYGGMLAFPEEKQLFYASTCNVWLPGARRSLQAAHDAAQAVHLYEQAPPHRRRTGELLLARLDLASAHLALGDLEGLARETRAVLAAASRRKTDSVRRRLHQVRLSIGTSSFVGSRLAEEIRGEITEYCA